MSIRVTVEVSVGELFDRISILELKEARLSEPQRGDVARTLVAARAVLAQNCAFSAELAAAAEALAAVNRALWDVEERLRECERNGEFNERFVSLARSVYQQNDRRAAIKRRIDQICGSELTEHKSHRLPES